MSIEEQTKESLIKDLEKQLNDLRWEIQTRTLEIAQRTEKQQVAKRKRKLLVDTIRFIKSAEAVGE